MRYPRARLRLPLVSSQPARLVAGFLAAQGERHGFGPLGSAPPFGALAPRRCAAAIAAARAEALSVAERVTRENLAFLCRDGDTLLRRPLLQLIVLMNVNGKDTPRGACSATCFAARRDATSGRGGLLCW